MLKPTTDRELFKAIGNLVQSIDIASYFKDMVSQNVLLTQLNYLFQYIESGQADVHSVMPPHFEPDYDGGNSGGSGLFISGNYSDTDNPVASFLLGLNNTDAATDSVSDI